MKESALKTIRMPECYYNIDFSFMLPNKNDIKSICLNHVDNLIAEYEATIAELQKGMFEETKSSAGDKYETARTQFQREIERLKTQITQVHTTKAVLLSLTINKSISVGEGSLLNVSLGSNQLTIYISAALGSIKYNDQSVQAISIQSPLGLALRGHKEGDVIAFNQKKYKIESLS
jgi:transcription elongation GreA/GreB family factor